MKKLLPMLALAAGCAPPAWGLHEQVARAGREHLRVRDGICCKAAHTSPLFGGAQIITTCARFGFPGTPEDDPKLPIVITSAMAGEKSPAANTGSWQMEVFYREQLLWKGMLEKHVAPELNCVANHCWSYSLDIRPLPGLWEDGSYTFRYTLSGTGATSMVLTNTIVIEP